MPKEKETLTLAPQGMPIANEHEFLLKIINTQNGLIEAQSGLITSLGTVINALLTWSRAPSSGVAGVTAAMAPPPTPTPPIPHPPGARVGP